MSEPYQSRVFNFINRKAIQLRDRFGETRRSLKNIGELGIQIILYPLYLLVQTTRVAIRQLKQTTYKAAVFLTNSLVSEEKQLLRTIDDFSQLPACDQPIQDILELIEPSATEALELPQILGIATILETRKLALVTQETEILDILTPKQQQQIEHLIIWELATYWRRIRLNYKLQQSPRCLPLIHSNDPNLLPPIRLFWQLIEWIQNSQLAIDLNLFEEASFITPITLVEQPKEAKLELLEIWNRINSRINQISQVSIEKLPIQNLIKQSSTTAIVGQNNLVLLKIKALIRAAIDYFFKIRDKQTYLKYYNFSWDQSQFDSVQEQLKHQSNLEIESTKEKLLVNSQNNNLINQNHNLETQIHDDSQILTLIKAAIDYFLGKNKVPVLGNNNPYSSLANWQYSPQINYSQLEFNQLNSSSAPNYLSSEPDPWLSLDDVFQVGNLNSPFEVDQTDQINISLKLPFSPGSEANYRQVNQSQKSVLEIDQAVIKFAQNSEQQLEQPNLITYNNPETILIENDPEWIEIEAKPIGYEKHPLELILQWLDQVMLWIEEYLLRFWDWLKHK
jgi:hypothetical protein